MSISVPVRVIASLVALIVAATAVMISAPGAQSASYRYWSYWLTTDGSWSYANRGPAFHVPADGSVEGWRFGISSGTSGSGLLPRSEPDFDRICAQTPAQDGRKRVALVVDPGLIDHAPEGDTPGQPWAMCVSAEPRATGFDVLRTATAIRTQRGLICALTNYPTTECAVALQGPSPQPTPTKAPASPRPESTLTPRPTTPSPTTPSPTAPRPSASDIATESSTSPTSPPSNSDSDSTGRPAGAEANADAQVAAQTPGSAPAPSSSASTSTSETVQTEAESTSEISIAAAPVMPESNGSSAWLVAIAAVGIAALALAGWVRARGRRL
jgi:hypothetical protein